MQQVGALNPSVKHNLNKTESLLSKKKTRPGGDLEKIYWMEMSMCVQIYLSYLMLRQRRGTRSICSWERRMNTGRETAAGGAVLAATIKALLMLLGFFWCYSNCKAALSFSPLLFLISSSPQEQQWKSILLSCFSRSHLTSFHPQFQELCCCCGAATSTVLDGKYSCQAFVVSFTTQEQIHCGPTISNLKEDFSKCVDLFGPDEKESYRWEGKIE